MLTTTVLLLCAYGGLLRIVPEAPRLQAQSQWQRSLLAIQSYLLGHENPDVVFTGSSLTRRLDFALDSGRVCNLGLSANSALTGLMAVDTTTHKPRIVFVEINYPERDVNRELIRAATGWQPAVSQLFLVRNIPVNFLITQVMRFRKVASEGATDVGVRETVLDTQLESYLRPVDPALLDTRLRQYESLIESIERGGTRVVLLEMPVHPRIAATVRAEQIRKAFRSKFRGRRMVEGAGLAEGLEIRTTDGLHLQRREAEAVSARLRRLFEPDESRIPLGDEAQPTRK